uniref:Phospholipase C n=1 Tax=Haptolina brevifila TaxID=156173 RepID=A0A7S2GIL3_9EUKA|mmetsp:Transcript_3806/g.8309  ORF Transcript_3806/g.8309 Transcript_3806/m.8309 type:complete len:326 (+) Transcript_3806:210-1187(+)
MRTNLLYDDCGGKNKTFPQMTIYDSMRLHNVSFGLFMNSTCGLDGKPCHGEDPITDDSPSAINTPDVAMDGVARHHDRFYSQGVFYRQAANGTLPAFSWLHPPLEACDHPCHDVAKGERLLKDVYEALRASPKWNRTLLFVTYDDAGGYYDHIVPPFEGVPADDAPCHLQDHCGLQPPFDFRRLGLRTAGMLISPLVPKGAVFQEPRRGPTATSQFELTSVASTIKTLFNLSTFLTKRDEWAGSFDELLLDEPRPDSDMPMHLPQAPEPAQPWSPPPGATQGRVVKRPRHKDDDDDDDDDNNNNNSTPGEGARLRLTLCQSCCQF